MMLDKIIRAIKANGKVSDWRLTETVKRGAEWYLVGKDLDTARSVESTQYSLMVYVDTPGEPKTRGAYSLNLHPTASDSELAAAVDRAVRAASGMRNPWYPIPGPQAKPLAWDVRTTAGAFADAEPEAAMAALKEALYRHDGRDGARINSLEIYLSRLQKRIVNSRGLDRAYTSYKGYTEFIVNAGVGQSEIELFGDLEFSSLDDVRLANAVGDSLTQARDRLAAVLTPSCDGLPVLFRGTLAAQIYSYWFDAAQAQAAFDKTSPFALGDNLGGPGGGDVVRLTATGVIPGNPRSSPCDADGVDLVPVPCIVDGTLTSLVGPITYTSYLGIALVGEHPLFELGAGTHSLAQLQAMPHLEVVSFSDFFVDSTTGDFGGELRLGYRVEGRQRVAVTGGSVTGRLADNRGRILLSQELETHDSCRGPAACIVPIATVAKAG